MLLHVFLSPSIVKIKRRVYSASAARIRRIYIRTAASQSLYYANTICIFFVRMYECRIHITRTYRDIGVKSFRRSRSWVRIRPVNVVSVRSSRNLGNFFRIFSSPSLRGSERQLRELFDADAFESQSRGFGAPSTSKLLLFQDPRFRSIRLTCNINFQEVIPLLLSSRFVKISILISRIDLTANRLKEKSKDRYYRQCRIVILLLCIAQNHPPSRSAKALFPCICLIYV